MFLPTNLLLRVENKTENHTYNKKATGEGCFWVSFALDAEGK